MTGWLAQWVEDFKTGRDAAYAERGSAPRPSSREASATTDTDDAKTAATGEDGEDASPSLVAEMAATIKALQTRNEELETERDEAKKLLAEVVAEAEPRQQRITELEGELAPKSKLIDELASQIKALQARADKLESEREILVAALQIPGMRQVMLKVVHEDTHPEADEEQRENLKTWSQAVNAAYALIKGSAPKKGGKRDAARQQSR
jgi:chromosome segregation ATPase